MAFFDPRYKLRVHILQIILVHVIIGVAAPRLFMKNQPRTRATTISLAMGGKSMIIVWYQILTEHVARFRRWRSLKAYAILNGLEVVFWAAVVFLVIQANIQRCVGTGCTLSWIALGFAVLTTFVVTPPSHE
ncbi:uncharacterized protein Z519_04217 [Cladophialophora bantiana CBS 173.52]|uniref:MARVEL domain-containing protein n=1 Tax=Cladophialophora bantiana (strain ATCC 10958 / CBS 173.52 / CDC B-1940 / NIH 8579) TaxID=1442370 RepID=A0A0D2GAL1_CLAB1|nr:uncharacterized protein Z519_04217 [Cladophialophora bantiana CBS 173.52]KIW95632.1 hypothetical protein Z519_04217 [Cladophialophora bantiana CBS 173.52]